jgi:hypothetical protein
MKIIVYRKFLVWRVKIIATNGKVVMNSEAYSSKSNALRSANKLASLTGWHVRKTNA